MIYTTLNTIRSHSPCAGSWEKLLRALGKTQADDEPLGLDRILEVCGLGDALWSLRCWPEHSKHWRPYAVWCARQVQHLMTDPRSLAALDVAEKHANGDATDDELDTAEAAARDAADAAAAASWAAANTDAAYAAWDAARDAAQAAVRAAQRTRLLEVVGHISTAGDASRELAS
jgi:hypothetical protein